MKKILTGVLTGLLLLAMLPAALAGNAAWPPASGVYQRVNQMGAANGILKVFHRPEGIFISILALDYDGDESGLIPAMERGGAARLNGAGRLQMEPTDAEAALPFMIATMATEDGDETKQCRFPANAYYRVTTEQGAMIVEALNRIDWNETVPLDGRYVLTTADPVVDEALAAYAVTCFANTVLHVWDYSRADRWAFDIQPAGWHESIGRLPPVMQVDVYFQTEKPRGSFLGTNDLSAVYRILPEPPVSLVGKDGARG